MWRPFKAYPSCYCCTIVKLLVSSIRTRLPGQRRPFWALTFQGTRREAGQRARSSRRCSNESRSAFSLHHDIHQQGVIHAVQENGVVGGRNAPLSEQGQELSVDEQVLVGVRRFLIIGKKCVGRFSRTGGHLLRLLTHICNA